MCNPTHEALERANEQMASVRLTLKGAKVHPLHQPGLAAALAKVHEAAAKVHWLSNGVREFGEAKDDDFYTV